MMHSLVAHARFVLELRYYPKSKKMCNTAGGQTKQQERVKTNLNILSVIARKLLFIGREKRAIGLSTLLQSL